MRKIQTGDEVVMNTGKDSGRTGKVLSVDSDYCKAIVEGLNMATKHTRPNPAVCEPGGMVRKEQPIHISNIAIYNPATGRADRVGIRREDGRKVRFYKSTGDMIA